MMNRIAFSTVAAGLAGMLAFSALAQAPTGFTLNPPPAAPSQQPAGSAAPVSPQVNPVQVPARPAGAAGKNAAGVTIVSGIGVVDVVEIMRNSTAMKSLRDQLTAQDKQIQTDFKKRDDDLKKEQQEIGKQQGTLPADQFNAKAKAFETKAVEFQRQLAAKRRQLGEGEQQSAEPVQRAIEEILQQIAIEKNYSLILHRPMVALNSPEMDVTRDVITRLNQKLPKVTLKLPPLKTN